MIEVPGRRLVVDVEPKMIGSGMHLESDEVIEEIIELPLVKAVKMLRKMNILTLHSSASRFDAQKSGYAQILLDHATLSSENQAILAEVGTGGRPDRERHFPDDIGFIVFPLTPDSTIEEVEAGMDMWCQLLAPQEPWRAIPMIFNQAEAKLAESGVYLKSYVHPDLIECGIRYSGGQPERAMFLVRE